MPSTSFVRTVCIALAVVALGGCASAMRTVEVAQPLSARPTPPQPAAVAPTNGSIFRTAAYRPLFEDQRARNVGDILTININEKINASKTATSNANRSGAMDLAASTATIGSVSIKGGAVQTKTNNDFSGKGDSAANNVFTGAI